ncbi:hypothetical protein [Kitasatospora sp. NPDC017646]|uniref:hypothetical protein n=1 Tax=Kitasatospora sp. NPDC017646 TaxID=3364024 RepID=UPI003799E33C
MATMAEGAGASAPVRVFLLDDHEVVRRGVHDLLDGESDLVVVVGEAATAEQAPHRPVTGTAASPTLGPGTADGGTVTPCSTP